MQLVRFPSQSEAGTKVHTWTSDWLKKVRELFHRKAGISNERAQRSLGQFFVVGNRQASVRRARVPQNNVAAVLGIKTRIRSCERF